GDDLPGNLILSDSYLVGLSRFFCKEFVMPGDFCRRILILIGALALAGCQQNPFASAPPPQPSPYVQQQQVAMAQQQQALQTRTASLDFDNQDLQTKLA